MGTPGRDCGYTAGRPGREKHPPSYRHIHASLSPPTHSAGCCAAARETNSWTPPYIRPSCTGRSGTTSGNCRRQSLATWTTPSA